MGETDLHIEWMIRLRALMMERYRGERAYVASNLIVYFEEGSPYRYTVPGVFVVLEHPPRRRQTYKIWEEKKLPERRF